MSPGRSCPSVGSVLWLGWGVRQVQLCKGVPTMWSLQAHIAISTGIRLSGCQALRKGAFPNSQPYATKGVSEGDRSQPWAWVVVSVPSRAVGRAQKATESYVLMQRVGGWGGGWRESSLPVEVAGGAQVLGQPTGPHTSHWAS